jgi:hypothetical protein
MKLQEFEIENFTTFAEFFAPNPRKILRITLFYRMVRLIVFLSAALDLEEFLKNLLFWILLLGQWPLHMAWMLQVIEDDEQSDNFLKKDGDPYLFDIYKKHVENRVYSIPTDPALAEYYSKLLSLDHDPEVFDNCLRNCQLKRSHLGGFSVRSKTDLLSFTQILNPSLQFFLAKISAHREDADSLHRQMSIKYATRSLEAFSKLRPQDFSKDELKKWLIKHEFAMENSILGDKVLQTVDQLKVKGKVMHRIVGDGYREALTDLGITSPLVQEVLMTQWIEDSKFGVSSDDLLQTEITPTPDLDVGAMIGSLSGLIMDTADEKQGVEGNSSQAAGDAEDKDSLLVDAPEDPAKDQIIDPTNSEAAAAPSKTVELAKRTTDDKTGKDHVGYTVYALVLSMLVFKGISTPIVFGLYANWGTGKSFIMNKVFTFTRFYFPLQIFRLISLVESSYC